MKSFFFKLILYFHHHVFNFFFNLNFLCFNLLLYYYLVFNGLEKHRIYLNKNVITPHLKNIILNKNKVNILLCS